jgi:hypothetical protein
MQLNFDNVLREIKEEALKQANLYFQSKIQEVESIYCSTHGSFPALIDQFNESGERQNLRFSYCCESQKAQVDIMLNLIGDQTDSR